MSTWGKRLHVYVAICDPKYRPVPYLSFTIRHGTLNDNQSKPLIDLVELPGLNL